MKDMETSEEKINRLEAEVLKLTKEKADIIQSVIEGSSNKVLYGEGGKRILIDNKPYRYIGEYITGMAVKVLAGIPENYGLWLKSNNRNDTDKAIKNEEIVKITKDLQHFFSGPTDITHGAK